VTVLKYFIKCVYFCRYSPALHLPYTATKTSSVPWPWLYLVASLRIPVASTKSEVILTSWHAETLVQQSHSS